MMFFTQKQISEKGATVLGHLSEFKDGDMLFMGWGRPDRQKGYPSTFQAFLDFLKDPKIDKEIKKHAKLIVGAGVWDQHARDYGWVKDILRQIEELDGGIYKGNACYVNGFFPNRLVGCATYSIFTSRFEPCGITPLESFASGTPVISTKTGGAPDFISSARGYLTKNAYLRSPEDLKLDMSMFSKLSGEELSNAVDAQRMFSNASEVKECILQAVTDYQKSAQEGTLSDYGQMVRDSIRQKIDWHENAAYNGGKSANRRYMTEVFEINKGIKNRGTSRLNRLVGRGYAIADALKDGVQKIRNKWTKTIIFSGAALAAFGGAAYAYIKRDKQGNNPSEKDNKLEKTA